MKAFAFGKEVAFFQKNGRKGGGQFLADTDWVLYLQTSYAPGGTMDTTTSSSSPSPRRRKEIVDRLRYKTIEGIERIIDRLRLDLAEASRRERDELAHQILPRNGGSEADMALGSPAPAARVDAIRSKIRNRQALMERVRTGEFPPTCQECEDDLPVGRITSPDTLDPNRCVDCASLRERTRKR